MHSVVLITSNPQKAKEIAIALEPYGIALTHQAIDLPEIQSNRLEDVIIDKVSKAYAVVQQPVIVDDAGIYFSEYKEFPGVYSRYMFMALDFAGLFKLIDHPQLAYFASFIAYKATADSAPQLFSGRCEGTVIPDQRGTLKPTMPYDSMFIPRGDTRTFAEMPISDKQKYDHRSQAIRKFANYLQTQS